MDHICTFDVHNKRLLWHGSVHDHAFTETVAFPPDFFPMKHGSHKRKFDELRPAAGPCFAAPWRKVVLLPQCFIFIYLCGSCLWSLRASSPYILIVLATWHAIASSLALSSNKSWVVLFCSNGPIKGSEGQGQGEPGDRNQSKSRTSSAGSRFFCCQIALTSELCFNSCSGCLRLLPSVYPKPLGTYLLIVAHL